MKPGDTVWSGHYGTVRKLKLIAIDGDEAFVRSTEDRHFRTESVNLHPNKKLATAAALSYRSRELNEKIRKLNELHDEFKKLMASVVESLEAAAE